MAKPALSVRARTTLGATALLAVVLTIAAIALITIMQGTMRDNVREAALLRARDLVELRDRGSPPAQLVATTDDDLVIQVLASNRTVVAASEPIEGQPPLAEIAAGGSTIIDRPQLDDDPFMVVAVGSQNGTLLVGRNLDLVQEAIASTTRAMLIGIPILVAIGAITTWVVTGQALAPVEAMRREVAAISESELHRRVPKPASDDEIARLAETMNEMLARLEASRARQKRFVSDASHELRSPIAAIRNHVEVALAYPDRIDATQLATDVLAEDVRLQSIAENLLFLARADEHVLPLDPKPVDLDDLVLEEAERLRLTTTLHIDTSGVGAARVVADRSSLERAVRNIVDNAARYATTRIGFSLRETNGRVVLQVDDDGQGIPEDARTAVFERFTRLDPARDRSHGGAGLGLAIVAEVVGVHGGEASVSDAPGGGARLQIVLPRAGG